MMAKEKHQKDGRGNPNTRPCFYKIMWPTNLIHLRIPPAFKKQLLNEQTDRATLRSPCGNWDVKLLQENGDIYFAEGWQDFVRHHSLGSAEFLLFNYNGKMSFDVVIFGINGCARNYESAAKSGQESVSSFTSTFPFFRYSIKGYNLGSRSTLLIPKAFSRIHLRPSRQIVILKNLEGISWRASILVNSSKHLSITGGWKAFSDDNSIKNGDVCIFELVEQNTMQVHIFR
ncbi:B3 domain-containing protein Os11g0197600-like [Sesamum indicum]|uniref:B3 domain-containing protein Os11g0197600-like n=1 Tax=Sesamum indicum TaxID=4182 RepID=A0A6I9TRH3_SESIN|nr:B3 domain-containing protein Os11g0197600-like [Sesamum indicum]XP_020551469.1 B3 domain-containing protein Os11g0197600-like [Sesamum indicum]XP_020551470.1 B3 domain-containing protein Os11g0197600-like [Sesamum indicum]XP_020551471.1 B3 domain-containing protein Os11g0197600-like [Sesamum indicum]XP_020551472.1 B3 domain-containing protein Os11g0197600-like [Sesamum indicum]XP_020551473.1 B3 domain-containing protein Os11g0197600-like [Sesamum indicum]